jgi:hypothetical protein
MAIVATFHSGVSRSICRAKKKKKKKGIRALQSKPVQATPRGHKVRGQPPAKTVRLDWGRNPEFIQFAERIT